jgi:DNA-nicking Smr family endonuclease
MDNDDINTFKQAVAGIKPLSQDKHVLKRANPDVSMLAPKKRKTNIDKQAQANFAFSDLYQAHFDKQGPIKYCRNDIPAYTLKQLRRGDFAPEWVLDCHGMTKTEMKNELISMFYQAHQQHVHCVSILHGIGSGVLKQSLPHYLVQHPNVQAFHQAPLEDGGQGALLVLLEIPEL